MATKKVAETAKEFYDKYKSKRYNTQNAGLCLILNYLYLTYVKSSIPEDVDEGLPESLYTPERQDNIIAKAFISGDDDDLQLVTSMQTLVGWLATAHDSAWAARMSTHMSINTAIAHVTSLSIIARQYHKTAEKNLGNLLDLGNPEGTEFVQDLAAHGEDVRAEYNITREYIINSLCYVHAYNTLIEMIGEELSIPEFSIFEINTKPAQRLLMRLSEKLHEYEEINTKAGYLPIDTTPIELVPREIPEQNLVSARICIRGAIRCNEAWSIPLTKITADYWRRIIGNG